MNSFLKLPIKEQEKIMSEVADHANKYQMDLVKRYDKKFGKAEAGNRLCDIGFPKVICG
ncbi:MAG: hypothetical protein V1649_03925 [Patescibacteria group bacterium]